MKTKLKIFLMLVLCIQITAVASAREKVEKVITKSFEAKKGSTLSIENGYGKINVQNWDKNEIYFEVKIMGEARTKSEAENIVNNVVSITFNQIGQTVSAKTSFKGNCNNCSRSIDYVVMVPRGINYNIENKYGNVVVPNIEGNSVFTVKYGDLTTSDIKGNTTTIDLKYGNLRTGNISGSRNTFDVKYGDTEIGELMGTSNNIVTSYGKIVSIGKTNKLDINIKYSKLKIGIADELNVESGYSNTGIEKVKKLNVTSKYENYTIGEVDDLKGTFGYTKVNIEKLNKSLDISEIKYNNLIIDHVGASFDKINIGARYADIVIQIDDKAAYNVDLFTKYSSIKVPSSKNVSLNQTEPDRNSNKVEGVLGRAGAKSNVKIVNSYGKIELR